MKIPSPDRSGYPFDAQQAKDKSAEREYAPKKSENLII